ncbi:MAG: Dam family site-specific DNA-(adenine-N6)-methyltransferase [Planctomycetia bacterium]|nr:Dam family site-specific DNA-(adenine-N6)-methyltransferase [Planctomycetia bacterium]
MNRNVPHIIQYQGSKRKLASQILQYMPNQFHRLVEPFSGMAAITVAAAYNNRAEFYYVNDINAPLIAMLREAIENPGQLIKDYSVVWKEQFEFYENHIQHFYVVRDRFNNGAETPANMLYLLARCVKGAVRYGKDGKFNQSPDKRRHGTNPRTLEKNVYAISNLLKGRTKFSALDYHEILENVKAGDVVYMDPPYQGVTNVKDHRYVAGVPFEEFSKSIEILNQKGVDYIISYDGQCGDKEYGENLPASLGCKKILLDAGLSSQALFLGKKSTTLESLYISKSLLPLLYTVPKQMSFIEEFV